MKPDESTSDDVRKEIEELRPRAKAGDPTAQIEIAGKLLDAANQHKIYLSRAVKADAYRWIRTAEINPALTDEQRLKLAEILLEDKTKNNPPPVANFPKAIRLLLHIYKYGADNLRGSAAYNLGKIYLQPLLGSSEIRNSQEVKWHKQTWRDIPRSFVWFRRAARAGNPLAADLLHMRYLLGLGVLSNENKARYWQARTQEILETQQSPIHDDRFVCWEMRIKKQGEYTTPQKKFESAREELFQAESEKSVRQAMEKLQECATKEEYAPAMALWCAEILNTGQKTSYAIAKVFLRDAVRQGHPEALAIAGRWLLTGGRGIRQDIKLARKLLARAAQLGNAHALAIQCRCALVGWGEPKNPTKAKKLWTEAKIMAISQGDGQCLYELYLLGNAITDIDSFPLLRPAAEAGDVRACFKLGLRYRRGLDAPWDDEEAQVWLPKAAFRRHPMAQYELAKLFCNIKEKAQAVLWFEKAMLAGIARAGIELGILRLTRNPDILQNWQEAERLFRRFCPLDSNIGYSCALEILKHFQRKKHFLVKPSAKQSERDQRFLDRIRDYLHNHGHTQAAHLSWFRKGWNDFEQQLQKLETEISKAELVWQADDEELCETSGKTFIKWARWFSSSDGQFFVTYFVQKGIAGKSPEFKPVIWEMRGHIEEMKSCCYWRAIQTLLKKKDLTTDEKKSINDWTCFLLAPYLRRNPTDSASYPVFIREAASFCCRSINNMKELGLSLTTIEIGYRVAATHYADKAALTWLISNKPFARGYLSKAVDAKIPLALRMEADRISANPSITNEEQANVVKLLQEAAEGGDAEAQCRQGETLLKGKSPEDWRYRACEWFLKAANQGHERATVHLGLLFAEEKPMEAIRWLKQVAENPEVDASLRASAECELGKLYLRRQQLADAANHLRTAAQNNNRAAMKLLALKPTLRGTLSDEEIQKWCLSLLKQKETDGQNDKSFRNQVLTRLGQVAKSKAERADWFRQAAEAGDGPGAYEWARCLLFDGKLQEANTWFQEAQKRCQGHLDGNRDLAAQAEAWYKCVFSMITEQIPPVPEQKRRELGLKTEPRP